MIILVSCSSLLTMAFFGTDDAKILFLLGAPLCLSSAMIGNLLSLFSVAFAAGGPSLTTKFVLRRLNKFTGSSDGPDGRCHIVHMAGFF